MVMPFFCNFYAALFACEGIVQCIADAQLVLGDIAVAIEDAAFDIA